MHESAHIALKMRRQAQFLQNMVFFITVLGCFAMCLAYLDPQARILGINVSRETFTVYCFSMTFCYVRWFTSLFGAAQSFLLALDGNKRPFDCLYNLQLFHVKHCLTPLYKRFCGYFKEFRAKFSAYIDLFIEKCYNVYV